jgi:RNA polymerase sigma-70 factor (ECF subfamily)
MSSPLLTSIPWEGQRVSRRAEMDRIATRDRTKEAYQELVHQELPALYSLARRLERDGAEDLVQEALLQGYRAFGSLKEQAAGGRWLKTILVNVFRDELRKRGRHVEEVAVGDLEDFSLYRTLIDEDPLPYSDSLHTDFLGAFDRDDLREVLLRMPEIYRAPLVLRYMDGFSTKEIARLLDAPFGTILARLHRGRQLFERTLWVYAEETNLIRMGDDDG